MLKTLRLPLEEKLSRQRRMRWRLVSATTSRQRLAPHLIQPSGQREGRAAARRHTSHAAAHSRQVPASVGT